MKEKVKTSGWVKFGRVIFTVFILGLVGLSVGLEFMPNLHTVAVPVEEEELGIVKKEEINMSQEQLDIYEDKKKGIQNILLIGVDEDGYDEGRSDVMIVASVDGENDTLKLTSVMRDTLAYLPGSDSYQKLNHSYMEGGPVETMKAMNQNFDLNMKDFVVVDFDALARAVDLVGGYPVYVSADEALDMSRFIWHEEGHQLLDGESALLYMRIRYQSGGDQGRNQRQRDLIVYLMERSKQMGKKELLDFAMEMMPLIRTSYSFGDIEKLLDLYDGMKDGLVTEQYSFPFDYVGKTLGDGLWYAVPNNLRENVATLQETIFKSGSYVPSRRVDDISYFIEEYSGVYFYP